MNALLSGIVDMQIAVALGHLVLGLVLALLLQWHYVRFGTSLSNRQQFARLFPLVTLAVVVVITVVKTSLALSLGLIGALSIVRFRTPIKEPEELAYLFIAIAIGIGLGADQVSFTVASTVFILITIAVFASLRRRSARTQNLYISVQSRSEAGDFDVQTVARTIASKFPVCDIRRVDTTASETRASFHIEAGDSAQLFAFLEEFKNEYPHIELAIVEQQRVPGV